MPPLPTTARKGVVAQDADERRWSAAPAAPDEEAPMADHDDRSVPEDVKEKFRAALAAKKGNARSAEGAANTGSVHGSETSGSTQRTFRRKSG